MAKPSIIIELDRPRRIRFTTNAMSDLEDALRAPLRQILRMDTTSFRFVKAALWSSFVQEDPTLTIKDVGRLMDDYFERGGELQDLSTKITEAFLESAWIAKPRGESRGEKEPPPPEP